MDIEKNILINQSSIILYTVNMMLQILGHSVNLWVRFDLMMLCNAAQSGTSGHQDLAMIDMLYLCS